MTRIGFYILKLSAICIEACSLRFEFLIGYEISLLLPPQDELLRLHAQNRGAITPGRSETASEWAPRCYKTSRAAPVVTSLHLTRNSSSLQSIPLSRYFSSYYLLLLWDYIPLLINMFNNHEVLYYIRGRGFKLYIEYIVVLQSREA